MTNPDWLKIDLKGFAQVLRNKGVPRVALEPISNGLDAKTTILQVWFGHEKGWAELSVTDDDPDGFADLRDAYTLYAPSKRREDPTKRGRFGQGDKELIAICATGGTVEVTSTTGTIIFDQDGRRRTGTKLDAGTTLWAKFRCTKAEALEFEQLVRSLIVPAGIKLVFNDEVIDRREPTKVVQEILPTVITDAEGNLTDTRRKTVIELIDPEPGETPVIYELGVPVVEHDGRWHVNIGQKIPLNAARDNVTPSYLRKLREIMLNETHDLLTPEEFKSAWVTEALPHATSEAFKDAVTSIHGKDAVIFTPNDMEANKRAMDYGRNVIKGGAFTTDTWDRIRQEGVFQPSGQVFPTAVPTSPDGKPPIERDQWDEHMTKLARYVQAFGEYLLGFFPEVDFHNLTLSTAGGHTHAWWDGGITFNLRYLGKSWPETADQQAVDALCLHEFAHHQTGNDHYNDRYINRLAALGAKARGFKGVLR